jgi:hypothetical protein
MSSEMIISQHNIEKQIFTLRGVQLMLDFDLAEIYNVTTGRLNEQVGRNIERFPNDFMFQLTKTELENLKSQNAISSSQQGKNRNQNFFITALDGRIEYVTANPDEVNEEMQKFYHDLDVVKDASLSMAEIFYAASIIHFFFVKIIHRMMKIEKVEG